MPRAVCGGAPQAAQLPLSPSPCHHLRVSQPPQAPGCGGRATFTPVSRCPGPFFWAPNSSAGRLTRGRHRRDPLNTKRWEEKIKTRARRGRERHTLRPMFQTSGSRWRFKRDGSMGGRGEKVQEMGGGAESWPQIPGQVLGAQQQAGPKRTELLGPS